MDIEETEKVHFKTNVLLKSIIGKDLIVEDSLAVLELVKNSFDALSSSVNIIFKNILENTDAEELKKIEEYSELNLPSITSSKLIIQDFGMGMTSDEIKTKWLNIAYSEKKGQQQVGGRILAGNKGVGRFSCDRLGKFLDLYSKTEKESFINHLKIDWSRFEIEDESDLEIQEIELDLNKITIEDFEQKTGLSYFNSGTVLEISHLRRDWDESKIKKIRKDLEKILNPNQAFNKDSFDINIIAKEFPKKINGRVENKVFSKLEFKATSITLELQESGGVIETVLQDKGRVIFKLYEKNSSYEQVKEVGVKIVLYYLNPYAKGYFKRQTGYRSVDFGSIFLFINGFRIPPYGDEGDDWLGLERRKGQGTNRNLGTREILGRIEVNDELGLFQIISNRSGVVSSEAFRELTSTTRPYSLFYKAFRRLERFVVEGINWDSVPKEIEKKVESLITDKEWDEDKEVYVRDEKSRDLNAFKSILKILNVRKSDFIDLKVDVDFIEEIADRQLNDVEKVLKNSLSVINRKGVKSDELNSVLNQIKNENAELSNLIESIQNLDNTASVNKLNNKYSELKERAIEVEKALSELRDAEEELRKTEEEKKKVEEELRLEKEKNTYLLASEKGLSQDAKGLYHSIKITSKTIKSVSEELIEKLSEESFSIKYLQKKVRVIKYNSEKALKITHLITRANFKTQAEKQTFELPKFLTQYLSLYNEIFEATKLKIKIQGDDSISYKTRKSILDISLIIDDLVSNAQKAKAKTIFFDWEVKGTTFEISISDDGEGLDKKFLNNPEKIFELGVTTTDGSGIGLNFVRDRLRKQGGVINYNGASKKGGASFLIVFSR